MEEVEEVEEVAEAGGVMEGVRDGESVGMMVGDWTLGTDKGGVAVCPILL